MKDSRKLRTSAKAKRTICAVIVLLAMGLSSHLKASTNESEKDIPIRFDQVKAASSGLGEEASNKLLLALGLVLVFAAGSTVFVRKFRLKQGQRVNAPQIQIQTQFHLGPKKTLAIVRVAGESILIGITDQQITHLRTLSLLDEDLQNEVTDSETLPRQGKSGFDELIKGTKDVVNL